MLFQDIPIHCWLPLFWLSGQIMSTDRLSMCGLLAKMHILYRSIHSCSYPNWVKMCTDNKGIVYLSG
jgi:hypothetical protein